MFTYSIKKLLIEIAFYVHWVPVSSFTSPALLSEFNFTYFLC